jgi:hypothetical protein
VHTNERNRLLNETRRFLLAASDMRQAAAAADHLATEHRNGDLCWALETAIVICYSRPFARGNKTGTLGAEWAPPAPELVPLHDLLLDARDKVYAHNDRTGARGIRDVRELVDLDDEWLAEGGPIFAEEWLPIRRDALPAIALMAEAQAARFIAEAEGRWKQLQG